MTHVIAYSRQQCKHLVSRLNKRLDADFVGISSAAGLIANDLKIIDPGIIFFPHWSNKIPAEIYGNYKCIIFHMTDLPYGRGGSPLQNLIIRGHKETMISALRCVEGLDAGPVYLKKPLTLSGSAKEIFARTDELIEDMIVEILKTNPEPKPQSGEVVVFKRRKPEDGDWGEVKTLDEIYDYIRMLDAEGYPSAYIHSGQYKLEFTKAARRDDTVLAEVKITKEASDE